MNKTTDIAIISMACRFPDADNTDEFWNNLLNGKSSVKEIPKDRWDLEDFYYKDSSQSISKYGCFLNDVKKFDPDFFSLNANDIKVTDPQQRILIELAYETILSSKYSFESLKGKKVGVFAGVTKSDYQDLLQESLIAGKIKQNTLVIGILRNLIASRISNIFDFHGPSLTIDTACSSSLVALQTAIESILNATSELALVGGINLNITPTPYYGMSMAGALTRESDYKVFDTKSNGFIMGEGGGFVLLKPLDKSINDGDTILGVIKGSAINNDGKSISPMAPRPVTQQRVVYEAYKNSGLDPKIVDYVEAHGTGTALGDAIEANTIIKNFENLYIGSVKPNIGHLLSGSGIAGLIKSLLIIQNRIIPPLINYGSPRKDLKLEDKGFILNKEPVILKDDKTITIGINSFGFGGTNAHVILQEYKSDKNNIRDFKQIIPNYNKQEYWIDPLIKFKHNISNDLLKDSPILYKQEFVKDNIHKKNIENLSNIYIISHYENNDMTLSIIRYLRSLGLNSNLLFDISDIKVNEKIKIIFIDPDYKTLFSTLKKIYSSNITNLSLFFITHKSIISNNDDTTNNIDKFLTSGLIFSAIEEFHDKSTSIKQIDFDNNDILNNTKNIINELHSDDKENLILYRNNHRLKKIITETEINDNHVSHIKKNGVYLVTGITGIMSEIIKKMSEYEINLFVCSRRNKNEIKEWNNIEQYVTLNNSTITYINADITNTKDINNLFSIILNEFKNIDGIIHGAGIAIPGSFENKSEEEFQKVLDPKVTGLILLNDFCNKNNIKPDFIISFSSLSSVISGINKGISDYSTANFFMDQYSKFLKNKGKNFSVINWGPWDEKGMASNSYTLKKLSDKSIYPISVNKGVDIFEKLLNHNLENIIVSCSLKDDILKNQSVNNEIEISETITKNIVHDEKTENKINDFNNQESIYNTEKIQLFLLNLVSEELGINNKNLDINSNLLDLGIDSLSAIDMAKKIQDLGFKNIPFELFFEYQTIKAISEFLVGNNSSIDSNINNKEESNIKEYGLSKLQQSFYKSYLVSDISSFSFQRQVINGKINKNIFEESIYHVLKKHNQLRANFFIDKNNSDLNFFQKINDYDKYHNIKIVKDIDYLNSIIETEDQFVNQKFDLENDILFKIGLLEINNQTHVFLLFHHIIFDGVSMRIFSEELWNTYDKLVNKLTINEIKLENSYFDFIKYSNDLNKNFEKKLYWQELIKNTNISKTYNYEKTDVENVSLSFSNNISNELSFKINDFSKNNQIPLQTIYLNAYFLTLKELFNLGNFFINIAVSGRDIPLKDINNIIGCFADTYPIYFDKNTSLKNLRSQIQDIKKYQIGSDNVVKIFLENNIVYSLFSFSFAVFDTSWAENISSINFKENYFRGFNVNTKFTLTFWQDLEGIKYTINYLKGFISIDQLNQFSKLFIQSLENIISAQNNQLSELKTSEIINPDKLNSFIKKEQDKYFKSAKQENIIFNLIKENCIKFPDKSSIVFKDNVITFETLLKRSSYISGFLLKNGFNSYSNIAVLSETSIEYIITFIAIIRIGATCIPIETSYPKARINQILKISNANLLIVTDDNIELDFESDINFFKYSDILKEKLQADFSINIDLDKTAYIIFTSGSTGNPKGVPISYNALYNYLNWCINTFQYTNKDKCVQTSSICFDASIRQILAPLITGGTVYPVSKEITLEPKDLFRFMQKNDITIWSSVPSLWNIFINTAENIEFNDLPNLRLIKLGGESLRVETVLKTQKIFNGVKIVNLYGPTETTINATFHIIDKYLDLTTEVIPIGQPAAGLNCKIFNDDLEVLHGELQKGELCVSGIALTSGYLCEDNIESDNLNKSSFFIDQDGSRYYKTGDIVSLDTNGNYIFHGRKDNQVKIRGHRVDLGELKNTIINHNDVTDSYVLFKDNIITLFLETKIKDINVFKDYLKLKLPEYLLANKIKIIDKFPVLQNGKLDLSFFKKFSEDTFIDQQDYSETEKILIKVWKKIFKTENITPQSNFFDLGGDSISIMQMFIDLEKNDHFFKLPKISKFYKNGNLQYLAQLIDNEVIFTLDKDSFIDYTKKKLNKFGLSPAQKGFFLKNKFSSDNDSSWKAVFYLSDNVNIDIFQSTLNIIKSRHQMLRVKLNDKSEPYFKEINENDNLEFKVTNINNLIPEINAENINALIDNIILKMENKVIDINQYPLIDLELLNSKDFSLIAIQAHHILADGLSIIVFINELIYIYSELLKNKNSNLSKLKTLKKVFSDYINFIENKDNENDSLKYWTKVFSKKYCPVIFNKTDLVFKHTENINISTFETIKHISSNYATTPFNLFLALFYRSLIKTFNSDELIIGIAHHGRDYPIKDINSMFGCFAKSVPIRISNKNNLEDQLKDISKTVKESIAHDLDPVELIKVLDKKNNINLNVILGSQFFLSYIDMTLNNELNENSKINIDWNKSYSDFEPSNLNNNIFLTIKKINNELSFNFIFKDLELYQKDTFIKNFNNELNDLIYKFNSKTTIKFVSEKLDKSQDTIQSALIGYLPTKKILNNLNINETIFKKLLFGNSKHLLLEIIKTIHGNTGYICLPFFAEEIQLQNSEIIKQYINEAINYCSDLGIKYISLAGMLPAITDYGNAIENNNKAVITTGHSSTVSAVIKNSINIIEMQKLDITKKKIAFIGLGSIGRATALNIFDYLEKPQKIILCDIYGSEKRLDEIEEILIKKYNFDGIIEKIISTNNIPDDLYNADIMICAVSANKNIIDINKLKPHTVIVDDSFPHCFDTYKAIERMKNNKDITVIGGGLVDIGNIERNIFLPIDNENIKKELSKNIISGSIASCQAESLLMIKNKIKITKGLVDYKDIPEYLNIFNKLNIKASPLHLNGYYLN